MVNLDMLTPEQREAIVAALEDGALVRRIGGRLWLAKLVDGAWELVTEDEQVTVAYDYSSCSCGVSECSHLRSMRYGV